MMGFIRRVFRTALTHTTPTQQAQVESFADEVHSDVEQLEPYGLTARPPADVNEGLAVFVGGQSDHGVIMGWFDKAHRPNDLQTGEVALYAQTGVGVTRITLKINGDIELAPASKKVIIKDNLVVMGTSNLMGSVTTGAGLAVTGDLQVSGNGAFGGSVTDADGDGGA